MSLRIVSSLQQTLGKKLIIPYQPHIYEKSRA